MIVTVWMLMIVLRMLLTVATMAGWMVMVAEVIIMTGGVWVLMGGEVTHGGQVSFRNWRAGSPLLYRHLRIREGVKAVG